MMFLHWQRSAVLHARCGSRVSQGLLLRFSFHIEVPRADEQPYSVCVKHKPSNCPKDAVDL